MRGAVIIGGDAAALIGTVGGVLHLFPEAIGALSALMGCAWFGTLLYDRWVKKRPSDDEAHPPHQG